MTYNIEQIDSIGPSDREQLVAIGINTTDDVLARCSTTAMISDERTTRAESRAKLTMTMARAVPAFPTPTRALIPS